MCRAGLEQVSIVQYVSKICRSPENGAFPAKWVWMQMPGVQLCDIIYVDGMPKRSVQAETLHNNYHILETSYLPRLSTVKLS